MIPDPENPLNQLAAGETRTRGFEFEVAGDLTQELGVAGTYSFTHAAVQGASGEPDAPIAGLPRHMASCWVRYRLAGLGARGWSTGAGVRRIGETTDEMAALETPPVTLFDAVAYETGSWRFALNATNLADNVYVATCLARGDCFYGSRRSVAATVRFRF